MRKLSEIENDNIIHFVIILELETKVKRRFAKVNIVSYSRPSLMIIVPRTQFHVERPWGQRRELGRKIEYLSP